AGPAGARRRDDFDRGGVADCRGHLLQPDAHPGLRRRAARRSWGMTTMDPSAASAVDAVVEERRRERTKRAFAMEGWDAARLQPGMKYGTGNQGMEQGMRVLSYLIAGLIFYGGLGWLGDHLLGTVLLFPLGMVLGMGLGVYAVIAKFGRGTAPQESDA